MSRNGPCIVTNRRAVALGVLGRERGDLVVPHEVVVEADVVGNAFVRHRRTWLENAGPLDHRAKRRQVTVDHHRRDHVLEQPHFGGVEPAHQPVVEERDLAARPEQVVARMRVAVERVQAEQAAEHEPEQGLRGEIPLGLLPRLHLGEAHALGQLGREHAAGAELGDDRRNVDEGMVAIRVGEQLLVGRLPPVVELFEEPIAQLLDDRLGLECGEQHPHELHERADVVEVGADGLVDAGVLHLDRDGNAVARHRPVDLADRR